MIACPECGGELRQRKNPAFRACAECGKLMVVTPEAQKALENDPSLENPVPAPNGLEVETVGVGDIVVPDYTDVMIGWRAWRVDMEHGYAPKLLSMNHVEWVPYEAFHATCSKNEAAVKKGGKVHEVPSLGHTCGVYSAKSRDHLLTMRYHHYDPDDPNVVVGEVNLWGRVVEGTQGWRAAIAYPRKFYVPHLAWRLKAPLEEAYGVECVLNNTLKREQDAQFTQREERIR